ncbi:MAG: amidohydrolase [Vicinamibacterales bacterium]|nr:amidohydrolase [Vicinamibacterales bacterium]
MRVYPDPPGAARRTTVLVLTLALAVAALGAAPPAKRRATLVVTGGTVITMDAARRVISPGAVAINGTTIVAVDTPAAIAARYAAADVIRADGAVVLPGLINTHGHAAMVMYRGLADDLALKDWLQKYIFPAEAKTVSPEMVRVGTRLAALEMLQSGTTLHTDMYYFEEEVAKATKEAGMRGVLGQTIIGFPVADAQTPAEGLARAERFMQAFKGDPLVVATVAPHSMYTVDAATLKATRDLARTYGVPLLTHLAETRDEVAESMATHHLSPAAYFESLGFWDTPAVAAHGVHLTGADIAILKKHGVALSHNPESNMKLASGAAPVAAALKAGLIVALGTDGAASNNDLDMFEAMRQAAFLHKLTEGDPTVASAQAVLEMATLGGAAALGMADRLGALEPGKLADLIVVSMRSARQTPMYNAVSHLVYATRGDDVRTTIVNGKILMRERRVLTLNQAAVLADARRLAAKVRAAVEPAAPQSSVAR